MMSEFPLPDDILVEILAYLSPSDIVRARQACRCLYYVSKQRVLWLITLARAQYAFPAEIDPVSLTALDLENLLIRAEVMDRVWSNSFPVRSHREKHEGAVPTETPRCLGMGPYVVLEQKPLRYSWYHAEHMEKPIYIYDATTSLRSRQQHVLALRDFYVERGRDACFIAHILNDTEGPVDTQTAYQLQVISVEPQVTGSLAVFNRVVERISPLDDEHLEPERLRILNRHLLFLQYPPKPGFSRGETVLLNIATGKQVHLLPPIDRPEPTYEAGIPRRYHVDPFITPSHYVQVVNSREISFYDLKEVLEASPTSESDRRTLRPSHSDKIPLGLLRNICIIPRSSSSFVMFGIQTLGNVLFARVLTIHLGSPTSAEGSSTSNIRIHVNSATHELWGRVQKVTIPPVSTSSGTALGVIFLKNYSPTTRRWEGRCMSIRITLGSSSLEPDFLISRIHVVDALRDGFIFHGFDPYAGRILAAHIDFSQSEGPVQRLLALDFLPSRK